MKLLRQLIKVNTCSRMLAIFGVALSLANSGEAAASCISQSKSYTIYFDAGQSTKIPSNTPIGAVVWSSTPIHVPSVKAACSGSDGYLYLYDHSSKVPQGNSIIPIGTTGLSYRLKPSNPLVGPYITSGTAYISANVSLDTVPDFQNVTLEIVKTGQVTASSEVPNGVFAGYNLDGGGTIFQFALRSKLNFTSLTCNTPNITVPMGARKSSEFNGIGSRLSPVGFAINLNACPAGIHTVKYRLDATTAITNSAASVVALSTDSIATGVGVQILDNLGNPFPLGVDTVLSNYAATGGNYSIPLKAAYYQTAGTIKGGTANASLTFTMTYQ